MPAFYSGCKVASVVVASNFEDTVELDVTTGIDFNVNAIFIHFQIKS